MNLVKAGYDVTVWNRNPGDTQQATGAVLLMLAVLLPRTPE